MKSFSIRLPHFFGALCALFFVCFLTVYVRTYPLRGPMPWESSAIAQKARMIVTANMKQQFITMADQLAPTMGPEERLRWADVRTQETMKSNKDQFDAIVQKTASDLKDAAYPHYQRHYLLEADPYFYYSLTRHLRDHGDLGKNLGDGYFHNAYRRAPHGVRERRMLHPYMGYYWYRFLEILRPGISLMSALYLYPVVLCVIIALVFFAFGFVYRLNLIGTTAGAIAMLLSPIFIQRSFLGWYDTDPYNYLFPLAILVIFFRATEEGRRYWIWGMAAGILTGLYPQFWSGWPFIWFLTAGCGVLGGMIYLIARRGFRNPYFRFTLWYAIFSLIFLALFMHPVNMMDSIFEGIFILPRYALTHVDVWPSAFLTVGETRAASVKKIIYLSGNYGTAMMAVLGVILSLIDTLQKRRPEVIARWIITFLIGVSLLRMAFKTERFVVLFVLPFSIFVAFGVHHAMEMAKNFAQKVIPSLRAQYAFRGAIMLLAAFLVLPMTLTAADMIGRSVRPIMNDTWYDSMIALKEKTPDNAVVNSWWAPGYFIIGVGERGATADGGAQHRMETYWLAKAFISDDEKISVGLFRMMSAGGVECMDFLQRAGFKPSQLAKIILDLVPLSHSEAFAKAPAGFSSQQKHQLLAFTHGNAPPPPQYVLLYNDMIEQNPAITLTATWDIEKAERLVAQEAEEEKIGFLKHKKGPKQDYLHTIIPITEILRYTPESELSRQEGTKLFFKNGLTVDLATMESTITIPEKNLNGSPEKFFYIQDGHLVEKNNTTNLLSASALLIKNGDTYTSVIADAKLIRSVMFRLYYLRGEGLKLFKPFFFKDDKDTKTRIIIYEIDWQAFDEITKTTGVDSNPVEEMSHG
ncbi:MAG: hypothetical protein HYZ84_02455 [Candidatus Omnitrophica bacterium]|nr:hypothetical protein [Candidatus Omnitrophota bacterium]